ncbi:hypothetical protein GH714_042113 [Hevea brasiliensis]|uniref:Auxin efflux carrier component n=1 Tax=Hevea brasiliensis TaxID=3981 RepID=A0A6A6MS98_HEVBR|nr:hypothetical protein GH714_042113 [Hevea brasiliensis]
MISWKDLYTVLTAVIPLYVAMILAYGSVRWWKIFSPDQCSGINRFVAIFAVPLLSFHFISTNDPYAMNFRFIAADTLQKIIMLVALGIWTNFTKNGSLEWMITIFSLSTLPNTLVMGIPLLIAIGAKMLIMEQFPETAASIVSFKVDSDVVSLDGRDFLETDAEIGDDGKLHVTVRKSNASRRSLGPGSFSALTPRPSNLTGAEIYSLSSSRNPTPRGSNFNTSDFYNMMGVQGFPGGRLSNFGPADLYSVQSSRGPTPRPSNFEENCAPMATISSPRFGFYPGQTVPSSYPAPNTEFSSTVSTKNTKNHQQHSTSLNSSNKIRKQTMMLRSCTCLCGVPVRPRSPMYLAGMISEHPSNLAGQTREPRRSEWSSSTAELHPKVAGAPESGANKHMPPASVMTRLILIMVWRKLIRNPNTYSSLIGLVWSLISFRWHVAMPKIIEKSISILSDAGLGMAMFSLGLFMALQPKIIACGNSVASFAMAVRFLTGPAVMAAASIAVGLRGTLLHVAIVQAALPQGIVPFVFAKEYNVHPAILSTAVIFGMLIALPITLVYYILLGL